MASDSPSTPRQAVAVIGGAVAGAQLARMLVDAGIEVTVFEQNRRPFGKIEDGLPRWHVGLRNKEFERITERLSHPNLHFVPSTRIGEHVGFDALTSEWGFTAVVLACGAWRDRGLPIDGVDDYVGKGLVYQNSFIIGFNHTHDPHYDGPIYEAVDDAIVVGGGLASIDVIKVLMLETTRKKLEELGHEVDVEALEKAGLDRKCEELGVKWEDLGLKGSTLFYRRQPEDMPLQEVPDGADEARVEKVKANRAKMLARTMAKYRFHFEELSAPEGAIVEDGRLVGITFRRLAKGEGRRLVKTDEVFERRGNLIISSIGSTPEPIAGVPMKGELIAFKDWDLGRLDDHPTVFSAGNVVTGKGNIIASRRHAKMVGERMLESYLGLADDHQAEAGLADAVEAVSTEGAEKIAAEISKLPALADGQIERIRARVKQRQAEIGFDGDVPAWLSAAPAS